MRLPAAKDISPKFGTDYEGNDERCAREHFLGKSLDEAEALFRQNALYYEEDLLWMGAPAFRYYVPAFIRYIRSEHSRCDPDAINCFASLVEQRAEQTDDVASIANELADACHYVLDHYGKFEADPSIYGDLRPRYESLLSRLLRGFLRVLNILNIGSFNSAHCLSGLPQTLLKTRVKEPPLFLIIFHSNGRQIVSMLILKVNGTLQLLKQVKLLFTSGKRQTQAKKLGFGIFLVACPTGADEDDGISAALHKG